MNEAERTAQDIAPHLERRYDDEALDRMEAGLDERIESAARRRRLARTAMALAAAACALLGSAVFFTSPVDRHSENTRAGTDILSAERSRVSVRFEDGSTGDFVSDEGAIQVLSAAPGLYEVALEGGAARFRVSPNPEREFVVRTEHATVTVLGTTFEVHHHTESVEVRVVEGRVRVDAHLGSTILSGGSQARFSSPRSTEAARDSAMSAGRASTAMSTRLAESIQSTQTSPRGRASGSWVSLAKKGKRAEAARLLVEREERVPDRIEELLLAADVLRLEGYHALAYQHLERIMTRHRSDSRWSMAAFLQGRLLLEHLGQPERAAERFGMVARDSSLRLSEDALARQVEALSRAGKRERAQALATEYVERYPHGHRLSSVRRFGGLDDPR